MDIKEANKVLSELSKDVRPEKLNEKAKRLFDAIMKIADERDLALAELDKKDKIINEVGKRMSGIGIIDEKEGIVNLKNKEEVINYFTKKASDK